MRYRPASSGSAREQFCLFFAVKDLRNRRHGSLLAAQNGFKTLFHQFAHAANHPHVGPKCLDDPTIAPSFAGFTDVGLQPFNKIRALVSRCDGCPAIATRYDKLARNYLAAVQLVAAAILLN